MGGKVSENGRGLSYGAGSGAMDRVRCHPDKACFREGTHSPVVFPRRLKPGLQAEGEEKKSGQPLFDVGLNMAEVFFRG